MYNPRENCIVCLNKIHRSKCETIKERRGIDSLTCKRDCAKIYIRISRHINGHFYDEITKLKLRIKKLNG